MPKLLMGKESSADCTVIRRKQPLNAPFVKWGCVVSSVLKTGTTTRVSEGNYSRDAIVSICCCVTIILVIVLIFCNVFFNFAFLKKMLSLLYLTKDTTKEHFTK